MTCKNVKNIVFFGLIAVIAVVSFGFSDVYAEENEGYKMIGDVSPVLTFTFRDGIETYEFPVFKMGENFVSNSGVSFSVEGTVTDSPLLHQAMDEAYKHRFSNAAFDYQLKYFDVTADFVKNGESIISLDYRNCIVDDYLVETLDSNDYESYFKKVGFAIVDKIDFACSGVNSNYDLSIPTNSFTDYGESGFTFANGIKTSVTFIFSDGTEKIEFPAFNLVSAYEESVENVVAEFKVEGILEYYPLLYDAIDNSRTVSGNTYGSNLDFDALVEFTNGEDVLRGLNFKECVVSFAEITTQTDKEEGFTGKSAFAIVHQLGFTCSGFSPVNMYFDELRGDRPIWKVSQLSNAYVEPIQNTDQGLSTFATFTFANGIEIVEFSMFKQNSVLTATEQIVGANGQKSLAADPFTRKTIPPTLELRGIVGDYPMLYNNIDENRKIQNIGGTHTRELVDIDIDIVSNGEVLRGFNYVNCRATNYDVDTNTNKEESYSKNKFAVENLFDFECQGYHPNNPIYDTMFIVEKANTQSTNDLRNTDDWSIGFTVQN